ncbi:MAG: ribonuclease D [Halioglobus sp.]
MHWELLESDEDLADMLADAAGRTSVAIDTEFMRRNTFYPQAALLQLCFEETAWLIDPLTLEDPTPLIALFEDPGLLKILHSASEDLEVFQQWLGVLPQPLFDTQKAAAMVGRGFGLGYRSLVMDIEGVDLPKGETRSDWLQRPLTDSQCDYAAMDVIHLLPAAQLLYQECEAQEKLAWVLSDGEAAVNSLASDNSAYFRKIKSAWKLEPRALGLLRAVCDWREKMARSRDKPRSWIIDDKACLEIAQLSPTSLSALSSDVDLPAPAVRRYGEDLIKLVEAQAQLPEEAMPSRLGKPLDAGQRNQVKTLKTAVKSIAIERAMAPESLVSGKDFEMLVREAAGEEIEIPLLWQGWRKSVVIDPLRQQLSGTS